MVERNVANAPSLTTDVGQKKMKQYHIKADTVSFSAEGGILTLAFAETDKAYLLMQRDDDDSAVYLEVNDQINSGYNLVSALTLGPGELSMTVNPEFHNLGNPDTIRITYPNTDQNTKAVREGLKQVMKNES